MFFCRKAVSQAKTCIQGLLQPVLHSKTPWSLLHILFVHLGYLEAPASQPEDRSVLTKLFGHCLAGDSALHSRLVDALMGLSAVEAECRGVGTSATLGPDQPVLANVVAETICGIRIRVGWLFHATVVARLKGMHPAPLNSKILSCLLRQCRSCLCFDASLPRGSINMLLQQQLLLPH